MRTFKFFNGVINDTIVYYSATTINDGMFWTHESPEEIRRQQRIEQQREQTNRLRQFGSTRRTGRNYITRLR
jgi:hypothetical protein